MRTKLGHLPELDGMRGLAAVSVMAMHVVRTARGSSQAAVPDWLQVPYRLVALGSLGVDVFFVLSGFLITSLLLIDREKLYYFRNFYWKRVLRIQPVYLLHMALVWFLVPGSHGYVLLGLVFLVNFLGYFHVRNAGPAWTLSIEEQFYLIWPQIVRRVSLTNLYWASFTMITGSALLRVAIRFLGHRGDLDHTWFRLDGLGMGALLACQWIAEGEGQTPRIGRLLQWLDGRGLLLCAILWQALVAIRFAASPGLAILSTNYLTYRLIGHVARNPASRWFGWLASRPLVFLGAISYSVYMLHTVAMRIYDAQVPPPSLQPSPFAVRTAVVVVTTLLASVAVRFVIELPAQRLRRYVLRVPEGVEVAAGQIPQKVAGPV